MLRSTFTALGACFFALPAMAATPESAVVSDSQPSAEWSGGPYLTTNITPAVVGLIDEEPVCEEGTPTCDVFRFEVNLSNANLDDDQVVISVEWPDPVPQAQEVPDYDIYLYDDVTGERVTEAATAANPEIMLVTAENRKYRVVIIPFTPMAQPYSGKVSYVPFEEEKSKAQMFFGGAFGAGALLVIAGFAALARRKAAQQ